MEALKQIMSRSLLVLGPQGTGSWLEGRPPAFALTTATGQV